MASLIAPEYFNNHIAVEGEIIVKRVPNDTGSVVVWNPTTKKLSTRTHAEIISDLDVMTLHTNQFVYGQKSFMSLGSPDEYANNLWVRSEDGSEPGITFWKTGYISSALTLRNDGFHFGVGANNHYDSVKAEGFRKNNSSDNFFLTGGGSDYDSRKKEDSWFHSGRNFPQGTLIETDVDYSVDYGDQFLLEIKGNMYGGDQPLDCKIQGYIYNGTIISHSGYSTLYYWNSITALNLNGKLCFWFTQLSYWQGFDVKVTVGYGGLDQGKNRVTSVSDNPDPVGTKRVQINLKHLLTKEELVSENLFWEKKDVGGYWALDSDKPIAGLNGNGAQVMLSGGLLASDSYMDKDYIPVNGLHAKGFVQTDEGFQNRFYKADERNRIWSFANADAYGLSYYQGKANSLNEGVGFHFGDTDHPTHFLGRSGQIYSKQGIYSTSFTTGNSQVLNYTSASTLYIGNPTINVIIESNSYDIIHYKNGVNGVVWDSHNLDPSTFVKQSTLNNYIPYYGATQDVNLGAKDLEFEGGGAISKHQNSVRIFNKVYQGYYDYGGHTGILAIKMPQASPDQAMFSIDINIYGYESQYLGKINVAFYKYVSGGMISNGSKAIWEITDNFPTTMARVGIGSDGYVSILLGEPDTFWNGYFSFEVAKVEAKYGNYNLDWNVGWSHAIESNFDSYNTNIIILPSDVVATRNWINNMMTSFALRDGSNAKDTWLNSSLGLGSNPGYFGRSFNSNGATSLMDATYGNMLGYINTAGNGAPDSQWYYRLKMLHQNSAGYNGEIAVQMTGGNSLQYRKMEDGKESGWIEVWDKANLSQGNINLWNLAYNHTISDVLNYNDINGDWTRYYRNDGSSFDKLRMGTGIIDSRVQGNGLGGNGSANLPNSGISALNHKALPLFHTTSQLGWSSSLIFKGWTDSYKAWKIMGPADNNNTEQDFYLSQTRSDSGEWMAERKIWTSKDFSQSHINAWNNLTNGIILNQEFSYNTGYGLGIYDNHFGGESGMIDNQQKAMIAGKIDGYYKYGSSIYGLEGINYHREIKNVGIGGDADSDNKVRVEGCVKAIGNFKSKDEEADTMFIPDGQLATLRDEIINDKSDYAIRLDPHEYEIDSSGELEVNDRNRLIHIIGEQVKMVVNFREIYPKQQIVIYNFDLKNNVMEVKVYGNAIYYIEPGCILRLYVTNSLRVIVEREQPGKII
ncbi:hypothetical protein N6B72_17455 [Chryseobacterium soli]|uniref:hypothetical protein n=1 Tax=Chryseobacterium soli TaxID=445961 RepID=UPI0029535043|nr:hypothetical protein [Chryseobacterium soli]MDV7698715.1 hypothetical protein [Chryseobacterium soli]